MRVLYLVTLAFVFGCGGEQNECCDTTASTEQKISRCESDPDACMVTDPPPAPPVVWAGTAKATPVFILRDPSAAQPTPITRAVQPVVSSTSVTGLCETTIPLTEGRFNNQSGLQCWTGTTLPAFLASDAPDTWATCDGATVFLRSLDISYRDSGRTIYMEGGATIVGCGRSWTSVLFQATVTR